MLRSHRLLLDLVVLSLGSICISACTSQPPGINPWCDDSISQDTWTTPSEQGVFNSGHNAVLRQRNVEQSEAPLAIAGVPHYPLWWEDEFEDKGDGDGKFAVTWIDYAASPACYARWLLNTVAWPASAVVTPPGTPMVSDGVIGQFHDAAKGESPNPTAGPDDFGFTAPDS